MATMTFKRKEMKYIMSEAQWESFMESISPHIDPTDFPVSEIRNLYLDTDDYEMIRRSIAKPVFKEKLRIRSYGDYAGTGRMFYEMKKKFKGIVYKRRFDVTKEMAGEEEVPIRFSDVDPFKDKSQTVREWNYWLAQNDDLKPRFFLSYDRWAYWGKENQEVRLTFDRNLTWREEDLQLSGEVYGHRLLEGQVLLEIKVPGSMPLWLSKPLSELGIYPVSYSKIGSAYSQSMKQQSPVYEPGKLMHV